MEVINFCVEACVHVRTGRVHYCYTHQRRPTIVLKTHTQKSHSSSSFLFPGLSPPNLSVAMLLLLSRRIEQKIMETTAQTAAIWHCVLVYDTTTMTDEISGRKQCLSHFLVSFLSLSGLRSRDEKVDF